MKLKHSQVKPLREQLLIEQNHLCCLCQQVIDPTSTNGPVLDHSHTSGHIRGVLHRFCNTYLSKIENGRTRNLITPIMLKEILNNVEAYMLNEREELHPAHTKVKRQPKKQKPVLRIVK